MNIIDQGNGWVFLNQDGKYAVETDANGFGYGKHINWTPDVNLATVFFRAEPWRGCGNDHLHPLMKLQPLKARVERVVKLVAWRESSKEE